MRRILRVIAPPSAVPQRSMATPPFSDQIGGAFGYVREHFIKQAAVSVELMNGILLHSVAVPSREWVADTADNTSTGAVDLPPVGSLVFVFFPYGIENTTGAFVLSSFFDFRNTKHQEFLKEGEEAKVVAVRAGGIKTTYDRETGNFTVEDVDDAKLSVKLDKENKKLTITDWNDNKVTLDADGMKLEGGGTSVVLKSDGSIEAGGNSKQFVTWTELNTALTSLLTQLNSHTHVVASIGSPTGPASASVPPTTFSCDISAAKTTKIKTGG